MTSIENIWREFSVNLRQYILKRTSDESIADDILQEIFVKIHSRIDTLKDIRRLHGWIYQIARHAIIDYYRSKKAAAELPERVTSLDDTDNNDGVDVLPCIEAMIDRLPEKYRQAVILTTYQGLTQKEMRKARIISFRSQIQVSKSQRETQKYVDGVLSF
jgi:RNA polymerase sigma-70 factor, ECF subfamily